MSWSKGNRCVMGMDPATPGRGDRGYLVFGRKEPDGTFTVLDAIPDDRQMVPYPDWMPEQRNAGVLCDMLRGPCACGAWH